jgi:hypothetical protein
VTENHRLPERPVRRSDECPCGYRPPETDDLDAWASWDEHLAELHYYDYHDGGMHALDSDGMAGILFADLWFTDGAPDGLIDIDWVTDDSRCRVYLTPDQAEAFGERLNSLAKTVNVHVRTGDHGDATKDTWLQPLIWFGLGFLAVASSIRGIVRRVRAASYGPPTK